MSVVLVAGIVDSVALVAAVFTEVVNVYGNPPVLSAWASLLALVMLAVLAVAAVVNER
jgi:hypothetical protein